MSKPTTLYQTKVKDGETEIYIGPRVADKEVLYPLVETVNAWSVKGKLGGWRDAHIEEITIIPS